MTHDRGEQARFARGGEAARRRADGALAPVAYLPWARPADASAAVGVPAAEPPAAGAPAAEPPLAGADVATDEPAVERFGAAERSARAPRSRPRREQYGDDTETGAEGDHRLDRLIVGRLHRSQLSVAEVRAILVEHGLDDGEVEEWVERYERLGYLDDRRAAEQLVRVQHERRGRGSAFVRQELARRGIEQSIASEAMAELDETAELTAATEVASRRAGQLRGLDRATAVRRLTAFLQRRGYPGGIVRSAVDAALDGRDFASGGRDGAAHGWDDDAGLD